MRVRLSCLLSVLYYITIVVIVIIALFFRVK